MIAELRELSEWFRSRGMIDNADFLETVAVRISKSPAAFLGSLTSDKKKAAAIINGKKGGRPRKVIAPTE